MKKFRANSSQRGFTLVELMIAMLIGVFLMAGVIQIFISAKQAYRLQENLSRLQENGRFAIDMMTKDIRMAGYVNSDCLPVTAPVAAFDKADATWCTARTCVASVTTPANLANTVSSTRTDVIRSFQWSSLVAASCPPTTANQSEISYFIRADDSNSNVNALWRYDGANSQERVESIERMQVLYGIDTGTITAGVLTAIPDYVPNYYADAGTILAADWNKIVSVRITLLVATVDDNLTDTPQPYVFNGGASITPTDRKIRREFSSTIAVRNRLP